MLRDTQVLGESNQRLEQGCGDRMLSPEDGGV